MNCNLRGNYTGKNAPTILYNCRVSLTSDRPESGSEVYPVLKALANETRLEILAILQRREMYAQQLVVQLGISQAAVSRHLNLMVDAGVLRVRIEAESRFYTIDPSTLARVAEAITRLGEPIRTTPGTRQE